MKMGRNARAFKMLAAIAGVLTCGGIANAASLGLSATDPDVHVSNVTITYGTPTATAFHASSTSTIYAFDCNPAQSGPEFNILGASFTLDAVINSAGVFSSGTFSVGGSMLMNTQTSAMTSLSSFGNIALQGTLTKFGTNVTSGNSPTSGGVYEFLFDVTGGGLASYYKGKGGIILSTTSFSQGNGFFQSPFTSNTSSQADVVGVPTPAVAPVGATLLAGIAGIRRRRRTEPNAE